MKSILRVKVNDDGTLQLPVDAIVAGLDEASDKLVDRLGLLPRKRPPAAALKSVPAVAAGATNANRLLSGVDGRLLGFAFRETAAAVASIELRSGTDASGDLVYPVSLAANGNAREWLGPNGVEFKGGLFLVRVAGVVDGAVFLGEI